MFSSNISRLKRAISPLVTMAQATGSNTASFAWWLMELSVSVMYLTKYNPFEGSSFLFFNQVLTYFWGR